MSYTKHSSSGNVLPAPTGMHAHTPANTAALLASAPGAPQAASEAASTVQQPASAVYIDHSMPQWQSALIMLVVIVALLVIGYIVLPSKPDPDRSVKQRIVKE